MVDPVGGHVGKPERSPVLAAFLAIFPGAGAWYAGNRSKALAYFGLFAGMVALLGQSHADGTALALVLAGFYVYQIIDSYNEACANGDNRVGAPGAGAGGGGRSLFSSVLLVVLGLLFQGITLGWIPFRDIVRLWPLLLVGLGVRLLSNYVRRQEGSDGQR